MDTSGTAKALVASFQGLGVALPADIVRVRDAPGQRAMGVPGALAAAASARAPPAPRVPTQSPPPPTPGTEAHLGGHAYHTYRLESPDGLVSFEIQARARRLLAAAPAPLAAPP